MTARGIRNNNPGNIRLGGKWEGLAVKQTDEAFCVFEDMEHGIRALIKVLLTYWRSYHLNTVHSIISRYAPQNENDTTAYALSVSESLGVAPHQTIDLGDSLLMVRLAKAIARHECGACSKEIDDEQWLEGARLAGLDV